MAKFFEDVREAWQGYQKIVKNLGKEVLSERFAEVLEKHPEIQGIRVCGYRPGFNDGDACLFRISEDIELQFEDGGDFTGEYDSETPEQEKIREKVNPDLTSLYEDLEALGESLENLYENFQMSYTRKDGFEVEYYDCGY